MNIRQHTEFILVGRRSVRPVLSFNHWPRERKRNLFDFSRARTARQKPVRSIQPICIGRLQPKTSSIDHASAVCSCSFIFLNPRRDSCRECQIKPKDTARYSPTTNPPRSKTIERIRSRGDRCLAIDINQSLSRNGYDLKREVILFLKSTAA